MNTSYRLFNEFFFRQTQASRLQLDRILGCWLERPETYDSAQHLCVLLSYAESICRHPEKDSDGERLSKILALYLPHEERALSEGYIDQSLIRGMKMRLSLPEAWLENMPHENEEVARQIVSITGKQAGRPKIPDIWQLPDQRKPSNVSFDYIMMLIAIAQHYAWPSVFDHINKHITSMIAGQSHDKVCAQHRWIGPFSVLDESWQSKAEDITYQTLYRSSYLKSTLEHDAIQFFRTLVLSLENHENQGVLRFLAYLSIQQANKSRLTRKFITRFLPEELDDWMTELLNQQRLLALLEQASTSAIHPPSESILDSHCLAELLHADILGPLWPEHKHVAWSFKEVGAGGLFIASDKNWAPRYNSNSDRINRAFEAGVRTVIANRETISQSDRTYRRSFLLVDNTFSALIKLAVARRSSFTGQLVAITGSVGKSSTAEMLYHTSLGLRRSYKNIPHFNHQTGVPISLVNIPDECELAVIEMGMGDVSTILPKSILARPHVAIITEIQEDHMEFHRSVESIVHTKMEIIEGLEPEGWLILNRDSPHFPLMLGIAHSRRVENLLTFGQHPLADICLLQAALRADHSDLRVRIGHQCLDFSLAVPGIHMAINSLAVIAAHQALGWPLLEALPRFATLKPVARRNQQLRVGLRDGRALLLIDDSFNINPASLIASIHNLSLSEPGNGGRRIMVTGDMGEMGKDTESYHEGIAPVINRSNIDCFYSIGRYAKLIHPKLKDGIAHQHLESADDLVEFLTAELRDGDVVAFKGSARDDTMVHIIAQILRA